MPFYPLKYLLTLYTCKYLSFHIVRHVTITTHIYVWGLKFPNFQLLVNLPYLHKPTYISSCQKTAIMFEAYLSYTILIGGKKKKQLLTQFLPHKKILIRPCDQCMWILILFKWKVNSNMEINSTLWPFGRPFQGEVPPQNVYVWFIVKLKSSSWDKTNGMRHSPIGRIFIEYKVK